VIENTPKTDVHKLMHRLQAEAERYRLGQSAVTDRGDTSLRGQSNCLGMEQAPDSLRPPLEVQVPAALHPALLDPYEEVQLPELQSFVHGKCKLKDILAYQDRAFIHAAYWTVLQRAPDEGGSDTYLRLLRGGASKIEILAFLCLSPEGRKISAPLPGLWVQLFILKLCMIPILGGLVRLMTAFWCLPETQRFQRTTEGRLHALIEQTRADTSQLMHAANHSLRELARGLNELTRYAATKADRDSVNNKASSEDMWRLLDEVHSSLQVLQISKASIGDIATIKANLSETASTLKLLDSSKAELALVDKAHQHFTYALQLKPDRDEVSQLIAEARSEGLEASATLRDSKVDKATFDESRELLIRAVQTKADRHELTTLTNYFVNLLQARLTKEDISLLEQSFEELSNRARSDQAVVKSALAELGASLLEFRDESGARVERSLEAVRDSVAALAKSKADLSALESAQADARLRTDNVLGELRQAVTAVSATKADRTALDAAIEGMREGFQAIAQSKADLNTLESAQVDARLHTDNALGELHRAVTAISASKADRTALTTAVGETRLLIDAARKESQDTLQRALVPITNQTRDVKRNLIEQERRVGLLLEEARKRLPKSISTRQIKNMLAEDDHLLDAMYASFEDIFRGTREDIKQRQSIYLPYVHAVQAGVASAPIVDIGCGRGEWLELLGDEGLQARGVDLNHVLLQRCRELNLNVVEGDAVAFLREQTPNSLGAVTSFHLIEHLPHKTLIAFLDAALCALRPGGLAICETPNPRNLQVGSCNFYLDPTHRNPLPPDLMRYLFEARGFVDIEIKELHPILENPITEGARAVTDVLNRFLFSAQDYAVIGKKP
jgi:SAM-dependent methyltransferase